MEVVDKLTMLIAYCYAVWENKEGTLMGKL